MISFSEPSLFKYSWLSLSRTRLSWITANLEVNIWSLSKHENLTTGNTILWKRKLFLRSNFSSFPQYFQYIYNFKSPFVYIFVKCGWLNYFFLNSANLLCWGTDISKYFRESLGIQENESRLYSIKLVFSRTAILFYLFHCCPSLLISNYKK